MTEQQLKERRAEIGDYYMAKREAEIFIREYYCNLIRPKNELIVLKKRLNSAINEIKGPGHIDESEINSAIYHIQKSLDTLEEIELAADSDPPKRLIDLFGEIAELKARLAEAGI